MTKLFGITNEALPIAHRTVQHMYAHWLERERLIVVQKINKIKSNDIYISTFFFHILHCQKRWNRLQQMVDKGQSQSDTKNCLHLKNLILDKLIWKLKLFILNGQLIWFARCLFWLKKNNGNFFFIGVMCVCFCLTVFFHFTRWPFWILIKKKKNSDRL